MGTDVGPTLRLHFSTNSTCQRADPSWVLHRRRGQLSPRPVNGIPILGSDRSFVDAATTLSLPQLVQAGDWLIHLGLTTHERLGAYVNGSHLDGVLRARRRFAYVRGGVESPLETLVRLIIVFALLPEPAANVDILDEHGHFLARGDLVYSMYKVILEYDGWHHQRDARQRQSDHLRLERLHRGGWTVVVVTAEDLRDPRRIAWRVYDALRASGYAGRPPHFNVMLTRWFA